MPVISTENRLKSMQKMHDVMPSPLRGRFSEGKGRKADLCAGGAEKTKPAKPKLLRVVCGADARPAPRGLEASGHEDGDEGQQENQHGASGRNDHGNVLDHVFHGIVRCMCVVVSRHGEPQNKNPGIVAMLGRHLPYIKA